MVKAPTRILTSLYSKGLRHQLVLKITYMIGNIIAKAGSMDKTE